MIVDVIKNTDYEVKIEVMKEPEAVPFGRRAFMTLGAEGSGTTMLTEALVAAGCHWEQWHESHHDDYKFDKMSSPFVFHRSLPHAGIWPDLEKILLDLHLADFRIHILFILRDWNATKKSVLARDPSRSEGIVERFQNESLFVIGNLFPANPSCKLGIRFDFTYITYTAFVTSEGFRRWLFEERLGLPFPADFVVENQNLKYYNDGEDLP